MHHNEKGIEIERRLNDAIAEIVKDVAGDFVVKWVAAVEVMPEDGDRGVYSFTSPDAMRWDIFGLLAELDKFEQAHMIAQILEDHKRWEED